MRIDQTGQFLKTMFRTKLSVELKSAPGIGKSSLVEQICAELSITYDEPVGLMTFMLSTIDSIDVGGFMYPEEDPEGGPTKISAFSLPPVLPHPNHFKDMGHGSYYVFVKGERVDSYSGVPRIGVLFLDEFAQATHDVQKPAADLILNRRIRGRGLPEGWCVWAASNREKDRSGVQKSLAFVVNRRCEIEIQPALDPWVVWAEQNNVPPLIIAWAQWQPGTVFEGEVPTEPGPFCTPRSLVNCGQVLDAMSEKPGMIPVGNALATEAAAGYIGKSAATTLMAFASMASELPTFEEIVDDPKGAHLPHDRPDAVLAITQLLAHRVGPETANEVFTYLKRLGKEFQVPCLKAALRRTPAMVHNPDFAKWLRDNKSLIAAASDA